MDSLREHSFSELLPLIREQISSGGSVRISPRGTSMLPMLRQGMDTVVLSPVPEKLKKYDIPFYRRDNGQFVLHRIVSVGETYTCVGDNQFQLEPGIRRDQVIAVVTAFTRNGREIPVTNFGYRCYCRFWHHSRPLRRYWRAGLAWLRRILRS
jgi:hypothetical protein